MAVPSLQSLISKDLDAVFQRPARLGFPSAWFGHVPFAQWLVQQTKPGCVVELGTHYGISYAAFCSAVCSHGLGTRCFAIDTWKGDDHAGHYPEAVYEELRAYNEENFGSFSQLVRSEFDEALHLFGDHTIDILHIDGFHTYEAVKRDFDQWLTKMSPSGIVLLHDIRETQGDFGVHRLWAELESRYPTFAFDHAHGLGVVLVGPDAPSGVQELSQLSGTPDGDRIKSRFEAVGERWRLEAEKAVQHFKTSTQQACKVAGRGTANVGSKPFMTPGEISLFESHLRQAKCYFEFGMGGSTLLAEKMVDRIWSVDSDASFVEHLKSKLTRPTAANLFHVDIGPTGQWGYPLSRKEERKFPHYSLSIIRAPCNQIDLCLVDGRFRVACFLQALRFLRDDAVIGFHDYPGRPQYHVIEHFARPISSTSGLVFFVVRPNLDRHALADCLYEHLLKPD